MSVGVVNKSTGDRIPTAGMPAIDDALSLISTNPVQNAIITAALADKQDKTDNNLQTTDKTVVGAVNELKSGLTNYENQNNLNLEVSDRKNILPCKLSEIKASNTNGTWADNVFTNNGVSFTINATDDIVTSIVVNGTSTGANTNLFISKKITGLKNGDLLNGCPANGGNNKHKLLMELTQSPWTLIAGANNDADDAIRNYSGGDVSLYIKIYDGYTANNLVFYPMVRPSWYTDNTFSPYIPSVESRIEAVESAMVKTKEVTIAIGTDKYDDYYYATNTHGITGTIISAYIIGVTQNHAAFLNYCNSTTIRVCSPISGVNVVVCVSYIDS